LLRSLDRLERIVGMVRARVPLDRSVSVKVRLGWESHDEVVAIARAAERGGASFLTVHGRTKLEMYGPPADWHAIGRARDAVGIVVLANGDLNTTESVEECRAASGCSRFMLGRGPMGRPSLLADPDALGADTNADQRLLVDLLLDYLERLASAGCSEGRQVARVKQWLALGRKANPELVPLFESVKRVRTKADLLVALSPS
jgi:tRNA-dihydrouridine synthase C